MDSYNFHFEKMSNFDLHPLSVSRLSPAKSSSSIDHYSHHHGKGDSAYSSFSGGSSAPDYHSPFLVDELHPHGLHYADLKYVKGVYGPHIVPSVSKTEACTHPHQDHDGCPHNEHAPASPLTPPPKPPVRLESLKTKTRYVQMSDTHVLSPRSDPVYDSRSSLNFSTNQDLEGKSVQLSPRDQYRQPQQNLSIPNLPPARDDGSDSGQHSWNSAHMVGGSIQHKGQYYFVTGMYKSSEFADLQSSAESRHPNVPDGSSGTLFFQERNTLNTLTHHQDDEDPASLVSNHFGKLESASLVGEPEDNQQGMTVNRHHPTNHPIFYCGPEMGLSHSANQNVIPLNVDVEQHINQRNDEDIISRRPFADVPAEKISKESTPLLYHLTGASRTSVMTTVRNETHPDLPSNEKNWSKEKQKSEKKSNSYCGEPRSDIVKEAEPNQLPYPCGTVDDSFKKYYKAKLKDVQSKVLRETSFKRRDLQLSLPSRIENPSDEGLSELFSEFSSGHQTQDLQSKLEKAPSQVHMFQDSFFKEAFRNCADETELETQKTKNVAQPQAPRVGWRRRLNLEQKKLSRSEPEKLDQLTDGPTHTACRSLGSEHESHLLEDPHTEQGLVASRRKIFEMRGRAMSASCFSKSSLKHLQQKALLAYMERKTGAKGAEPQQASAQLPVPGRLSDPTPHSGPKKKRKLPRPLSAGRLLDLTSVRYAQFSKGHSRQSSWIEGLSTPTERSDSSEYLPEKQEQPPAYRSRSTSIPHTLHQIYKQMIPSSAVRKEASRAQQLDDERTIHKEYAASVPDQRSVRLVASRGKSMEELGVAKVWRPNVLSKSSEHLHHLQENPKLSEKDMAFLNQRLEKVQQSDPQHGTTSAGSNQNTQLGSEHLYTTEPCPKSEPTSTAPHRGTTSPPATHSASGADVPLFHPIITTDEPPAMFQHSTVSPTLSTTSGISKMNVVQEVALSVGVTTEPDLWLSSDLDVVRSDEDTAETQEAQPQCEEMGAALNPSPADAKPRCSSEEGKEKSEDETHATKSQWEILVEEVVAADQSLASVLFPITNRKTAVMLLEQLLCEDTLLMEEHYRRKQEQQAAPQLQADHSSDETTAHDAPNDGNTFGGDVTKKKRQLMAHIENQLKSLEGLRSSLQVEQKENSVQGESIAAQVRECCLPAELERYTQFVEDLERVINLLLCLSARLARVQNALSTVDSNTDSEEKQSLEKRHDFLCKQRDDAKDLKDNLDRRERIVAMFLSRQLPENQLQEYKRFVQVKASLLIRQKDLEEKQRLGEEQLDGLLNSIPL